MDFQLLDTGRISLDGVNPRSSRDAAGIFPPLRHDVRMGAEVVDFTGLTEIREPWKELCGCAVEPNVFYDPDFALPTIDALGLVDTIRAVAIWSRDDSRTRPVLTGLFPFVLRRRWGVPPRVAEAFIHPYAMSSVPLVDAAARGATFRAFFDWLDHGEDAPAAFVFKYLPERSRLYSGMIFEGMKTGALTRAFDRHGRAVLDAAPLNATYFDDTLSAKTQKEYRRLRRRLAGHGTVTTTRAEGSGDVDVAMAEFLELEASGWKGRRGTAAAKSSRTFAMFMQIADGLGASHQMRIDALRVGDCPIAMAVSCGDGQDWWLWKIAYDESFSKYSPGVLLVIDITEKAIRSGRSERYDSCALPGHPMIERIWRQRRPFADLLVAPARAGTARKAAMVRMEAARRHAEAAARGARGLLRRR